MRTSRVPRRRHIASELELDTFLTEHDALYKEVSAAEAKRDARIARATARAQKAFELQVGDAPARLADVQERLTAFALQRRNILIRRFKSDVVRPMGTVKYRTRAPEMEWPEGVASLKKLVKRIEAREDGMKYLVPANTLNRKAIASAPVEFILWLMPDVWRGSHLHVTLQTKSMPTSLEIAKRRVNERPLRRKM